MDVSTALVFVAANLAAVSGRLATSIKIVKGWDDSSGAAIRVRLITERARFKEWLRRMGLDQHDVDYRALKSQLPQSAQNDVLEILKGLHQWLESAEQLQARFGIQTLSGTVGSRDKKPMYMRLQWALSGHEKLRDLVDTLHALNNGLETIAPPPPGYFVHPTLELHTAPNPGGTTQQSSSSEQSIALSHSAITGHGEVGSSNRCDQDDRFIPSMLFHPTIEFSYTRCLECISIALPRLDGSANTSASIALLRLKLWGSSLFHGSTTLDQLLNPRTRDSTLLRDFIVGTLADIAVTLEYLLNIICEEEDPNIKSELNKLAVLMSGNEMADASSDEVDDLVDVEVLTTEIKELVENLFDVLPTIRRLRQVAFLQLEQTSHAAEGSIAHSITTVPTPVTDASVSAKVENLQKANPPTISRINNEDFVETRSKGPMPDIEDKLIYLNLSMAAAINEATLEEKVADEKDRIRLLLDCKNRMQRLQSWNSSLGGNINRTLSSASEELKEAILTNLFGITGTLSSALGSFLDESILREMDNISAELERADISLPQSKWDNAEEFIRILDICISNLEELHYATKNAASQPPELIEPVSKAPSLTKDVKERIADIDHLHTHAMI
ncbi:MAG: hypothetical protein M1812_003989 [Candelaria pacifica]|nr:MAG: hypothetical protein M1812_003989 [Candelaria pacifica]